MIKKDEAEIAASRELISDSNLSHNSLLRKPFEHINYNCVKHGRRPYLAGAPPYLTYTDKSPSTPEEIDLHIKKRSFEFYKISMNLYNENKIMFRTMYLNGFYRIKFINYDNMVLYSPPNRGGSTSGAGYDLAKENSNKTNARISSKNRAMDKALANVDTWEYFCTFTLDKKKQDRYDFQKVYHRFSHFLQARGIKYFIVPERHKKDGAWHFHALMSAELGPFLDDFHGKACQNPYIRARLARGETIKHFADYTRTFGYNIIEPCKNKEACARYMMKYVLKTFDDPHYIRAARRRYFCSTGLKSARVLHPVYAFKLDLNDFEPVRFSALINKVVLKRYDPEFALKKQEQLEAHYGPSFCLKE